MGVKADTMGSEQASDVDLSPVLEFQSKENAISCLKSDAYQKIKPYRTSNSTGPIAMSEANLLPTDFDTSSFRAYLSTIKQFTDKKAFAERYPPLMKANNEKFGATMIARVPLKGEGCETLMYSENCDDLDIAVLIEFPTYDACVEYLSDPEFGAKQTQCRIDNMTGPLTAIKATSKTDGPFLQYSGVSHER